jgi:hypothetical protein
MPGKVRSSPLPSLDPLTGYHPWGHLGTAKGKQLTRRMEGLARAT